MHGSFIQRRALRTARSRSTRCDSLTLHATGHCVFSAQVILLLIMTRPGLAQAPPSQTSPPAVAPPTSAPAMAPPTSAPATAPDNPVTTLQPSATPGQTSDSADDTLERELAEAAAADARSLAQHKGADATLTEHRQAEDPLRQLLGKGIVGNEANPSLSLILDFVGSYFSRQERVHLGGHAPASNGIAVTGAELAASANVDPYFRLDMALCFAHMHLEEIYLTTLSLPWNFQFRGGQFLSKLGRHNPTHPHSWHFVLHPLPSQYLFGAEGLGAPGIELSWLAPLPWYVEIIAALQVGEGGAFRTKPLSEGDPSFKDFLYPLRLVQFFDLADDWALQLGANLLWGSSTIGPEVGNRSAAYGGDFFLKWRPIGSASTGYTSVAWLTEVWFREMEVPHDLWRDFGGYLDLIFGLSKRWSVAVRGELWRRLSGKRPSLDNSRDTFGLNTERGSVALSFMPSHFSRVRLQYTAEHVEGFAVNQLLLVQLEVSAGAHGAHAY